MSDFVVFNKLRRAIEFCKSTDGTFVFSWELNDRGCRRFLVSSKKSFWSRYKKDNDKNCYEVIISGSVSKLYFDLEYYISENQDKDGELMTKTLINRVNECLFHVFGAKNKYEEVLILDSSFSSKFSAHLIFKNICFKDNVTMGDFVRYFELNLNEEDKKLFQVNHKGKPGNFIDKSVYSENRNFRLYLSTKYQKPTPLTVSNYDESVLEMSSSFDDVQYNIFESSLITNIGPKCNLVNVSGVLGDSTRKINSIKVTGRGRGQNEPSPYPELCQFVQSHLKPDGFIHSWHHKRTIPSKILFSVGGDRFCPNVNRDHTSNNTYYVCDLVNLVMNQYCHSCIQFRGQDILIPKSVFDWIDELEEPFSE